MTLLSPEDGHLRMPNYIVERLAKLRLKFDSLTPTILFKRMPRAKHTISRAITELENEGLVKRRINASSHKSILISLTDKGEKRADKAIADVRGMSYEAMDCLNKDELQTLDKMLKRLRDYFLLERH